MADLPTGRADWRAMGTEITRTLRRPRWFAVAVVVTVALTATFVAAPRLGYVTGVVLGGSLSIEARLGVFLGLHPLADGRLLAGAAMTVAALAVGTNVAVLGRRLTAAGGDVTLRDGSGSSAGVVLAGAAGACPACVSGVGGGVLSAAGVAGGLAALPLHGAELYLLAVGAAVLSIHWLVANEPEACRIDGGGPAG